MPTAAAQSPSPHPFRLRLFEGGLGAEVEGITVSAIDDATFPAIYDAFLEAPAPALPRPGPAAW